MSLPPHAFIDGTCVALAVPKGTRYTRSVGGPEAVAQSADGTPGPVIVLRWPGGDQPEPVIDALVESYRKAEDNLERTYAARQHAGMAYQRLTDAKVAIADEVLRRHGVEPT